MNDLANLPVTPVAIQMAAPAREVRPPVTTVLTLLAWAALACCCVLSEAGVAQVMSTKPGASPAQSGKEIQLDTGPCGTIISSKHDRVGFGQEAQCILLANKCTVKIDFRVSSSATGKTKLSETVAPGKTGKICATKASEVLTYLGWKFEGDRWPK